MTLIEFRVAGIPRPGGSKRAIVNKYTGRAVVVDMAGGAGESWTEAVAAEARAAADFHGKIESGVALHLDLLFLMPRPKSAKRGALPITRPDVLKLARRTEDAMTGVLYHDDAQIVRESLAKGYSENGWTGVRVRLESVPPRHSVPGCAGGSWR